MNPLALVLVLSLATPPMATVEPPLPRPEALTPREAEILAIGSKCAKKLNVCRFDRDTATKRAMDAEVALETRMAEPPPEPETRVPAWFWFIAGGAVLAAGAGGVWLGLSLP